MSSWKQRLRSSNMATDNQGDDGSLTLAVLQAFKEECVVEQLKKIFRSTIAPLEEALRHTNDLNDALRRQIAERDARIEKLEGRVTDLELRNDDLEQQGRKGSIRIFGLPESDKGTLEEKVLRLCNDHLKLQPPIIPEDIEVAHRLGKPPPKPLPSQQQPAESSPHSATAEAAPGSAPASKATTRAVLVKLASRRTKGRIMDDRSNLKDNPYTLQDGTTAKVYIGDDLTKRRATLAFKARQLRNDGLIQDTWITNCKILVKNKHGRISQIYVEDDLKEFLRR